MKKDRNFYTVRIERSSEWAETKIQGLVNAMASAGNMLGPKSGLLDVTILAKGRIPIMGWTKGKGWWVPVK